MDIIANYIPRLKVRFPLCRAYQNMSFLTHVWQKIGQSFVKQMKCVENFALSYIFPTITCMKSEFLSSIRPTWMHILVSVLVWY